MCLGLIFYDPSVFLFCRKKKEVKRGVVVEMTHFFCERRKFTILDWNVNSFRAFLFKVPTLSFIFFGLRNTLWFNKFLSIYKRQHLPMNGCFFNRAPVYCVVSSASIKINTTVFNIRFGNRQQIKCVRCWRVVHWKVISGRDFEIYTFPPDKLRLWGKIQIVLFRSNHNIVSTYFISTNWFFRRWNQIVYRLEL